VNWISKWFDPAGPMSSNQIGDAFADYLVGQARGRGVRESGGLVAL
jgi:Tetracyclin repressor-like, C-terminal domain